MPNRTFWIIATVLAACVVTHLDAAVALAIDTDWLPLSWASARQAAGDPFYFCSDVALLCPRLSFPALTLYAIGSVVLAVAPGIVLRGARINPDTSGSSTTQPRPYSSWATDAIVTGTVAAFARILVALKGGPSTYAQDIGVPMLRVATAVQALVVVLGITAAVRARTHISAHRDDSGRLGPSDAGWVLRHRFNIAVVVAYALIILVVGITRDQLRDAIRFIDVISINGLSAGVWLLASATLLSAVLLELGTRIERQHSKADREPLNESLGAGTWLLSAAVVAAVAGILAAAGFGGRPLFALSGLLAILAGLERFSSTVVGSSSAGVTEAPAASVKPPKALAPILSSPGIHYVALAPLVVSLAAIVVAAVDTVLTHAWTWSDLASLAMMTTGAWLLLYISTRRALDTEVTSSRRPTLVIAATSLAATAVVWTIVARGLDGRLDVPSVVVLLVGAACYSALALVRRRLCPRPDRTHTLSAPRVAVALACGVGVGMHADPHGLAEAIGAVGLLNLAAAAAATLLNLIRVAQYVRAPRALGSIGIYRFPIATVLLAWIISIGQLAPATLNDVRLEQRQQTGQPAQLPPTPTLESVFNSWVAAQPEFSVNTSREPDATTQGPVPMILVASHGGGIRAAYWTALAMDCIIGVGPTESEQFYDDSENPCADRRRNADWSRVAGRVMIASGVSGGAVGFYAYARALLEDELGSTAWVDERLGRDMLAATAGWGLFHDLPNRFFGLAPAAAGGCGWMLWKTCLTQDRSAVLAEALAGANAEGRDPLMRATWHARSSADAEERRRAASVPLIVTNSATPRGGLRAITSAADLGPWPHDTPSTGMDLRGKPVYGAAEVSDMLCATRDITLSTAAVLSARFPIVSSPGRIYGHCGGDKWTVEDGLISACLYSERCTTQMVDGGYADNSGLLTIAQVWPELRKLIIEQNRRTPQTPIAVVIVNIDSHNHNKKSEHADTYEWVSELMTPFVTTLQGSAQAEYVARGILLSGSSCFETLAPASHPGATVPLGWLLSATSRAELRAALVRADPSSGRLYSGDALKRVQSLVTTTRIQGSPMAPSLQACVPRAVGVANDDDVAGIL